MVERQCVKCRHKWIQRGKTKPKRCSKCRNPNWEVAYADDLIERLIGI
jgi:ribosomal protein L37AE/L43A